MSVTSICAKGFILCLTIITAILSFDYKYEIMPCNTVFLLLYIIIVLFITIWISFLTLQRILIQNIPFNYTNPIFVKITQRLAIKKMESLKNKKIADTKVLECIDIRIDKFVSDIERMFVRKWYSVYISENEMFLTETRNLLDIIVRRFLQISQQLNSDKLMHGALIILLKHIKEYKKAVKKTSNLGGSVENNYRYTHIGSKSSKALEHFTMRITFKLLRHFINWELYNSLACKCVSSILAKKLLTYLLVYTSSPGFINYRILYNYGDDSCRKKLENFSFISISDVDHQEVLKELVQEECKIYEDISATPKKIETERNVSEDIVDSPINVLEEKGMVEEKESEVVKEESTTPVTSTDRVVSEPVKIYESKSANKTWRNSKDLDCISLGHDILYLSDMGEGDSQSLGDKKQWKIISDSMEAEEAKALAVVKEVVQEELDTHCIFAEHPKVHTATSNIQNFLRPATTGAATLLTHMKPIGTVTATTMKELNNVVKPVSQATTHAMHKINDFQDEAAGVVEGILDFGMAGLRKGLRLTGLQDNIHDSIPTQKSEKRDIPQRNGKQRLTKLNHVNSDDVKIEEIRKEEQPEDTVWVNPLLQDSKSPSFEGDILLEKSPVDSKLLSRESTKSSDIPGLEIINVDSPDLEYEDTTDLATTTAKLRSLLAQKTTESALNTPTASPISLIPTPVDPSGSCLEELSEVDGALPSMYKAFAKTATGVFQNTLNTLKTALPGNVSDQEASEKSNGQIARPTGLDIDDLKWDFVQVDPQPNDLSQHMEKFLSERRVFCTIDNAYEAMEAVEVADQMDSSLIMAQQHFEDELDDFDTSIPLTKTLLDLICELIEDTYPPLVKENIVKVVLLLTGRFVENIIHDSGERFIKSINGFIGNLPNWGESSFAYPMKINELVDEILHSIPGICKYFFIKEKDVRNILKVLFESLQSQKINQDSSLQLLELFASEIVTAAGQSSPTYSA